MPASAPTAAPPAPWPPLPPPHTRVGVGGILVRDGRVLVNRAFYRNRFTIPGGFVDAGEPIEAALVREFAEETGVTVRVGPLVMTRAEVTTPVESAVYFAFRVEHRSGEPSARPPEIAESREVPVVEAIDAPWISELSRLAIRIASAPVGGWPRTAWAPSTTAALSLETYHPPFE
jgi:ADP-ribose pyrophosphatase YjhB (NUDIX family)